MPKCTICKVNISKDKNVYKIGLRRHCGDRECLESLLDIVSKTYAKKARIKREKKERFDRKEKLAVLDQTVKHWRPKADTAFQLFSRLVDHKEPCASCGKYDHELSDVGSFKWHGGHYKGKGSHGSDSVRYWEDNCNKQCAKCNIRLSGNISDYRPRLLEKIGEYRLSIIEGPHDIQNRIWSDYKAVYDWYHQLNKILKKEIENGKG